MLLDKSNCIDCVKQVRIGLINLFDFEALTFGSRVYLTDIEFTLTSKARPMGAASEPGVLSVNPIM